MQDCIFLIAVYFLPFTFHPCLTGLFSVSWHPGLLNSSSVLGQYWKYLPIPFSFLLWKPPLPSRLISGHSFAGEALYDLDSSSFAHLYLPFALLLNLCHAGRLWNTPPCTVLQAFVFPVYLLRTRASFQLQMSTWLTPHFFPISAQSSSYPRELSWPPPLCFSLYLLSAFISDNLFIYLIIACRPHENVTYMNEGGTGIFEPLPVSQVLRTTPGS